MKYSLFKILAIFSVLSMLGLFITPKLSIKLNPNNSLPSITINYYLANVPSYLIEKDITSLLEASFSTLKGLKKITSKSSKGKGFITLEFNKHTNIDIARFETATIIRQIYKKLPENCSYPSLSINRTNNEVATPFLSYSINAPDTPFNIQEIVNNQIKPIISNFLDIDKIQIYGANKKEYRFTYNSEILKQLDITKLDLISALQRVFKKEALGNVSFKNNYISLSIQPLNTIIFDWHIPVKKIEHRIIYLDELVSAKEIEQEAQQYYRINGKNSITLNLFAVKNANTIVLAKDVDTKLHNIQLQLPQGYSISKTYDSTEYLKFELRKIFKRTLYTIFILFFFILLAFKSIKYLLISIISLFANISIAFLLYYIFKIEIQLYSLAGITISLGLIIDNNIVMIDHIRHQANKKIFLPILASTMTSIGALTVIYFLNDKYKANLIDFALVIIINLSVSLIIVLFLIPSLLEKIKLPLRKEKRRSDGLKQKFYLIYNKIISVQLRYKNLIILLIILIFGLPIFMLPQKLENNKNWHEKIYNKTIGNEWYSENIRPIVDKYLGGTLRLFSNYVFDNAFYNRNEETKLYVNASMEKGATIHQMNNVFLEIESSLDQYNEIKQYVTYIKSQNYAQMEITFNSSDFEASFPYTLRSILIKKVLDFGGMDWDIYGIGKGFSQKKTNNEPVNFSIKAKGYNYNDLNTLADTLKITLEKHPRIQDVLVRENNYWAVKPSFEYHFSLNKELLTLHGINQRETINELNQLTLAKNQDVHLNIQGKYIPIRFQSVTSENFDIWHVKNTPLNNLHKNVILKDVATITKERERENIYKVNQEYVILVDFQYIGSEVSGSLYLDKTLKNFSKEVPLGYSFEKSDIKRFGNPNSNNNYIYLLLLVLGIIYLICSILFESLKQPFIILSIVPISFIGVFLTFYLFDFNFDQGGFASFILLSGITVNASIFIVNGFNNLKKEHPDKNNIKLYLEAFKQKIYPIILTISSTVLGFIPFVIDGQNEVFWFALGVGTIGGLIFSLFGILFYLPIFTLKKV